MGDGPTWNIYRTQWRCIVLEGCVLRYLTLSYGIACLTATGCTKPESWCKIQKRTSLPKERNLFGWLLLNLRQGGTCKWAYTKTCAHMEMSANIKSPASESSFNQEGDRAASEAPIMREVLGLTQEVWSFRLVCSITTINRDNVHSARKTRPCCRLLIFNTGKKMRLTFLQLNSLQCQSDLKAEQNLNLCLNCLGGSSWVSMFSSVYTNALFNVFCFPFCLFDKRRTTGLDMHYQFWAGTDTLKMS